MFQNHFGRRMHAVILCAIFLAAHAAARADSIATQPTTAPAEHFAQILHAGPISLKFADGELRSLRVGDREIVRRIYFAVREARFASTDMPRFSDMHIESAADHFAVHFAASCRGKTIAYDWTADITGTSDGKIIYRATGSAPADGTSARIGLCVLFGSQALPGHTFATVGDSANERVPGQFPELVSRTLVAKQFHTLQYAAGGLHVSCGVPESFFDMEDQRTYGDTSFKAYNPMPYAYPKIEKGNALTQTLTLSVSYSAPTPGQPATAATTSATDDAVHVSIGAAILGARVCALTTPDRFQTAVSFGAVNGHREKYAQETAITWNWTTATHLPDEDTAMENTPAIIDQAKTIRSFAPRALLRVGPISLNGGWTALTRPPGFAAAWTTAAIHALSQANVDEAAFLPSTPQADRIVSLFNAFAGKPLVSVNVSPSPDIDAFAVNDIGVTTLFLVNRSVQSQRVVLDNLPTGTPAKLSRPAASDATQPMKDNTLELAPYEVCRIAIPQ